ncbi:hypothetical protein COLO4_22894 [Corchorus olitorius]|uniref:Toprim domain-containing protein n=1 Tax=Corchorus olitorius TaxID=93759 RepID=A0A1R3IJ97_9ROSI|nr:hypothetical protein COLO4_22894 [Corchorus olitorius]
MLRLPYHIRHNPHFHLHKLSFLSSKSAVLMASKTFSSFFRTLLPSTPSPKPNKRLVPSLSSKPISKNNSLKLPTNGFSSLPYASVPTPVYPKDLEEPHLDMRSWKILNKRLTDLGINTSECVAGVENRLLCPSCNGGESEEISLSLFIEEDWSSASWLCFRAKCGWKGGTKALADGKPSYQSFNKVNRYKAPRQITVEGLQLEPLSNELIAYFAERMISAETLKRNNVMQKRLGEQEGNGKERLISHSLIGLIIAFTYWCKGALVNCKYRDIEKRSYFTLLPSQEKDTEKIFYGLDDIEGESDIIIVEGEMDKLAMEEAGFRNCVSVPDGAPPSVSPKEVPDEEQDTKYRYLWKCKEYLATASRIILATDGDIPGQALAEELARRIGRERCWRVKWPKKNDTADFKDANELEAGIMANFMIYVHLENRKVGKEGDPLATLGSLRVLSKVLMYLGPNALKDVIDNAEIYPIRGLFNFSDFFDEIDKYYHRTLGYEFGVSTGWRALDDLYNVVPGELTIVTGVPNSGKSEWIDALLCNLNENVGWKFALCSMENKVRDHARKLLEKYLRKPFFDSGCENDSLPSIKWVLELARSAVLRHGVRGLVIDPYNELDHQRPVSQTETEYVSQMLTLVKRFAQHHSCHVWFVAHPRQLHHWVGAPPNLYDISGSAHFINKCDNGIVIHRNRDPDAGPIDQVQVCVRKVRNKVVGTIGDAFLSYDRSTGVYMDIDATPKPKPKPKKR